MTVGSILLGIALLAAVVLYLSYPFWGETSRQRRERKTERELLLEQKEALLDQIRTLDFDYETGKIPDDLHQAQRAQLMASATEVLQQLDTLAGRPAGASRSVPADDDIEAAIAQARRRARPRASKGASPDADIEAAIAQARQKRPSVGNGHANFCPQCGQRVGARDKFCAACGHKLTPVKVAK